VLPAVPLGGSVTAPAMRTGGEATTVPSVKPARGWTVAEFSAVR